MSPGCFLSFLFVCFATAASIYVVLWIELMFELVIVLFFKVLLW